MYPMYPDIHVSMVDGYSLGLAGVLLRNFVNIAYFKNCIKISFVGILRSFVNQVGDDKIIEYAPACVITVYCHFGECNYRTSSHRSSTSNLITTLLLY